MERSPLLGSADPELIFCKHCSFDATTRTFMEKGTGWVVNYEVGELVVLSQLTAKQGSEVMKLWRQRTTYGNNIPMPDEVRLRLMFFTSVWEVLLGKIE